MAFTKGNPDKKSEECKEDVMKCPNLKCIYEGWESETYECKVCGEFFKLYYDEMR